MLCGLPVLLLYGLWRAGKWAWSFLFLVLPLVTLVCVGCSDGPLVPSKTVVARCRTTIAQGEPSKPCAP
jgi:hypothetical protein